MLNRVCFKAARNFFAGQSHADRCVFDIFCQENAGWLDDYALFMACKAAHNGAVWVDWDSKLRRRDPGALTKWREELSSETNTHKYAQFEFFRQWERLKTYCRQRGISIMG